MTYFDKNIKFWPASDFSLKMEQIENVCPSTLPVAGKRSEGFCLGEGLSASNPLKTAGWRWIGGNGRLFASGRRKIGSR